MQPSGKVGECDFLKDWDKYEALEFREQAEIVGIEVWERGGQNQGFSWLNDNIQREIKSVWVTVRKTQEEGTEPQKKSKRELNEWEKQPLLRNELASHKKRRIDTQTDNSLVGDF